MRRKILLIPTIVLLTLAMIGSFAIYGCKNQTVIPTSSETTQASSSSETSAENQQETSAATTMPEAQTLVVALTAQSSDIDPHITYVGESDLISQNVYEGLFGYKGQNAELVPILAESYEINNDNTEYTIKLRQGVKFQDGTDFNADAVIFNYDRQKALNEGPAWMLSYIKEVQKIDDYTVKFVMNEPTPGYLHFFASIWGLKFISPKAIKDNEKNGDWAKDWVRTNAVGTGPYKFDEWVQEQQFVISKFDGYWKGWNNSKNNITKVIIKIIKETNTQRMLLEKGDLDMALMPLTTEDYKGLSGKEGVIVESFPGAFHHTNAFNCQKGITKDKTIRQALSYAFNYDAVLKDVFGGRGIRMMGPLLPGFPGYSQDYPIYNYDLNKAKELLKQAGYPEGGFQLEWNYMPSFPEYQLIGQIYQSDLKQLGIDLVLNEVPMPTVFEKEASLETSLQTYGGPYVPDNKESYALLDFNYDTKATYPTGMNYSFYSNPEVDKLFAQLKTEGDENKIAELNKQITLKIIDDAPRIWIALMNDTFAYRNNIKGAEFCRFNIYSFDLYNVTKE